MTDKLKMLVISEQTAPVIRGNFDEVKAALKANLEKFEKVIVTDETQDDCKAMQKELGAIRRELDGSRMDIKREISKPITEFDGQMKELLSLVASVEDPIKKGLSVFDEKRIAEKLESITFLIARLSGESNLPEKYDAQIVSNPKWANKGFTLKAVEDEVVAQISNLKLKQVRDEADIAVIQMTVSNANIMHKLNVPLDPIPYVAQVVDKGWTISEVLQNINTAAEKRAEVEKKAVEIAETKKTTLLPPETPKNSPERPVSTRTVVLSITTTEAKLKGLGEYLRDSEIVFEKVDG